MRKFLPVLALSLVAAAPVHAQDSWPARSIRMVVPFPAGGPTDIVARLVGQHMAKQFGQSVVVDNKPGAHGFIGAQDAARAAPDGYTIMMASIGTMAINPKLYSKLPYDANKDFVPVSLVTTVPIVLVVNASQVPVNNTKGFVQYLKQNPGKVNYGSAGTGGSSHLVPEYFKFRTGTDMLHVPYKGSSPAVQDLVGGTVQVMFDTLLTATPHVKSGKLKMLATTTAQRLPQYPDVPTVAEELGLSDFEASSWYALYAPAGTPDKIVQKLAASVNDALAQPDIKARMNELGAVPVGGAPSKLATFMKAEQDKWGKVIQGAGIKAD